MRLLRAIDWGYVLALLIDVAVLALILGWALIGVLAISITIE